MSDNYYDSGLSNGMFVINDTDVDTDTVLRNMPWDDPGLAVAAKTMKSWYEDTHRTGGSRRGNIFDRDQYVTPRKVFQQFGVARTAIEEDDIVSGAYDVSESLAFSKMGFVVDNEDEQDIWNQIARDIDLDSRFREMWRDLFTYSQFYVATYYGHKTYKVRGRTKGGNAKRKTFEKIRVPLGMTLLDPCKILPVGSFMFNQERLVYIAEPYEAVAFDKVLKDGLDTDPIVGQLIVSEFPVEQIPNQRLYQAQVGYEFSTMTKLYLLNPNNVWRHTLTRPQYSPLAAVRMKSVFELLDMKRQLKHMDRATLLGATRFILHISKGSDAQPAQPAEIAALANYARVGSEVPLIVSDHRLKIEIITPKVDMTLARDKYDIVDSRIAARLFQMFVNPQGRQEDSMKLARVVARGIENRRHMLNRAFFKNVILPTYEENDQMTMEPGLDFYPKRVALDFDFNLATFFLDLRDRGELSRGTMLDEFDFDQEEEARKRKFEAEVYDPIFETQVPYSVPAQKPKGVAAPQANNPRSKKSLPAPADPGPQQNKTAPADTKGVGRNRGGNRSGGGAAKPSNNRGKSKEQQA